MLSPIQRVHLCFVAYLALGDNGDKSHQATGGYSDWDS